MAQPREARLRVRGRRQPQQCWLGTVHMAAMVSGCHGAGLGEDWGSSAPGVLPRLQARSARDRRHLPGKEATVHWGSDTGHGAHHPQRAPLGQGR